MPIPICCREISSQHNFIASVIYTTMQAGWLAKIFGFRIEMQNDNWLSKRGFFF